MIYPPIEPRTRKCGCCGRLVPRMFSKKWQSAGGGMRYFCGNCARLLDLEHAT